MTTVKEKAYAKINLYLDVSAKREDVFHERRTVMHSVSLCDDIKLSIMPSHNTTVRLIASGCGFVPTDSKNLAHRAATLFLERIGKNATVSIELTKNIPVAAGLAGGSSDAAAVLRAMNKAYRRPFSTGALAALSAELGSDVPYCVMGKTALCEGRGEVITALDTELHLYTVIAIANERTSTPEAYRALDDMYSDFDGSISTDAEAYYERMMRVISEGISVTEGMYNIFESAVLPRCLGATKIKARLLELGADSAMMSGSGPSVFGVFSNMETAKNAADALSDEGYFARFAESV